MSETTKWTAGPWCIEGDWANEDCLGGWLSYNPKCPIAMFDVTPILGTPDEIRANANLIASAPELYGALVETLAEVKRGRDFIRELGVPKGWAKDEKLLTGMIDRGEAALAKARGEK